MMATVSNQLRNDSRGAVAVEMALTLPIIITLMIGILQFALILQAGGALRHGIGEGLRMAKVNPAVTEAQIRDEVRANLRGIDSRNIQGIDFVTGTTNGANWGRVDVVYQLQPIIPFAPLPSFQLNESRTVYLPS